LHGHKNNNGAAKFNFWLEETKKFNSESKGTFDYHK
jgi:hypothetical protein